MMKRQWWMTGALALSVLGALPVRSAGAAELELRVLLIAVGDREQDPGREWMEGLMDSLGVPYETLDASQQQLTAELLYQSPTRGRFNGIILTDSETYLADGSAGFDAAEFALLHGYERDLGVREAVLSGYPTVDQALGLDYGMDSVDGDLDVAGAWQGAAGGPELFEYINVQSGLPTEDFAFLGLPRAAEEGGPRVEPLLVDAEDPERTLISRLSYADGREVLLSTLNNASFYLHSNVLAYEFLSFATRGVFLGARRAYLAVHNDDLFLADEIWNPATRSNYPEQVTTFRLGAADIERAVAAQAELRARYPLAGELRIDFAFNGSGANLEADPLTAAIVANAGEFGFINHTFEAIQMDWLCPDENSPLGCERTDLLSAVNDIQQNTAVWIQLGLPGLEEAGVALLSDSHSGLSDRQGTPELTDDIAFPDGSNPAFLDAAAALGIRTLASDVSRPNQDRIQRVPGREQVILPRYPTALFYNTSTPDELVAEYNYLFHERYLEAGGADPCEVPEALCEARSYEQILAAEADTTLRHILGYQPFPHYFHQTNLRVYDAAGRTLQFDWLDAVLASYSERLTLPIENLRFEQLGDLAWNTVLAREALVSGVLDTSAGTVTLSAQSAAEVDVTGLEGGETYGGQSQRRVAVGAEPVTIALDLALER